MTDGAILAAFLVQTLLSQRGNGVFSRILRAVAVCTYALLLLPSTAKAQDVPLSQLLVDLIQSDIRLAPPAVGLSHEAHFVPGADQQIAPFFFNQQLILQLGTFPLGSPSGGFSYMFDSGTGTFQRATATFGPLFAERALTIGKKRFSVGANWQYSKYSTFEGTDLDSGDIKFYLTHAPVGNPPFFFEGDLIEAALRLDVSSNTTTMFANYGLTNAWDVSVAVPFQHVKMDAAVDATVLRLATGDTSTIHQFPNGTTQQTFTSTGSASGIGDILIRTKYRFLNVGGGGLAAAVDVRLPTGDEENLLGTGATQTTFMFVASSSHGRFAPHFNTGYTASSSGDLVDIPNEFSYRGGTEFEASPRITIVGDFLGRTLINSGRMEFGQTTHNFMSALGVPGSITTTELHTTDKSLNLTSLAVGGKFNIAGNLLINANVLFSLGSRGVTAPVTPLVGVDYSF
jgi:hypothetical protein